MRVYKQLTMPKRVLKAIRKRLTNFTTELTKQLLILMHSIYGQNNSKFQLMKVKHAKSELAVEITSTKTAEEEISILMTSLSSTSVVIAMMQLMKRMSSSKRILNSGPTH